MAIAAAVTAVLVSIGFLAGFFTAKHIGTEMMTACYRGSPAAAAAAQKGEGPTLQAVGLKRGMPVDGYDLREVAPPWSAEADRFREMQTTASECVRMWGRGPKCSGSGWETHRVSLSLINQNTDCAMTS